MTFAIPLDHPVAPAVDPVGVVARAAEKRIEPATAIDPVIARSAIDAIVAIAVLDAVIAGKARDEVGGRIAGKPVAEFVARKR
jgi:hypothetical protein